MYKCNFSVLWFLLQAEQRTAKDMKYSSYLHPPTHTLINSLINTV
jgi:hypothetical protein